MTASARDVIVMISLHQLLMHSAM